MVRREVAPCSAISVVSISRTIRSGATGCASRNTSTRSSSTLSRQNGPVLALYRDALAQWWRNIQREKNPLWTFIYSLANPGAAVDLPGAMWTLERIPVDLVDWTVLNSPRGDVPLDGGKDRFGKSQTTILLPADERPVMKWNGNPFVVDGGNGGASEDDGAFFLLPYWLGRFHGFITAP